MRNNKTWVNIQNNHGARDQRIHCDLEGNLNKYYAKLQINEN